MIRARAVWRGTGAVWRGTGKDGTGTLTSDSRVRP